MNINQAAKLLIPELTDPEKLMRSILDEKDYNDFHRSYIAHSLEMEHIDMIGFHNEFESLKMECSDNYNLKPREPKRIYAPNPKTNLATIISSHIGHKEAEKILLILKKGQSTKIRLIYRKNASEKSIRNDILNFTKSYKYITKIAHDRSQIEELKINEDIEEIESAPSINKIHFNIEARTYKSNNFIFEANILKYDFEFPPGTNSFDVDISGKNNISDIEAVKKWNELKENSKISSTTSEKMSAFIIGIALITIIFSIIKKIFS